MDLEVTYRSELELLTAKSSNSELKYRVYQIYGQKYIKLLDHPTASEKGTEIYAANIPRNIAVAKLFKFFAQSGMVYQIRLLMDFSGTNRGRCFVHYYDAVACRRAICCLHDEIIEKGYRVMVKLSLNNNQLILRSIPSWIKEEEIRSYVVKVMGEGLTGFSLKKFESPRKNLCFCTYRDHQFAIMAHKKSWPYLNFNGAVIDVHWTVPDLLRKCENLYFTNFAGDMTKQDFFEELCKIVDVETIIEFRMAKKKGFITFISDIALLEGQKRLQNLTIKGVTMVFSRTPFKKNQRRRRSKNHPEYSLSSTPSTSSFQHYQPFPQYRQFPEMVQAQQYQEFVQQTQYYQQLVPQSVQVAHVPQMRQMQPMTQVSQMTQTQQYSQVQMQSQLVPYQVNMPFYVPQTQPVQPVARYMYNTVAPTVLSLQ